MNVVALFRVHPKRVEQLKALVLALPAHIALEGEIELMESPCGVEEIDDGEQPVFVAEGEPLEQDGADSGGGLGADAGEDGELARSAGQDPVEVEGERIADDGEAGSVLPQEAGSLSFSADSGPREGTGGFVIVAKE